MLFEKVKFRIIALIFWSALLIGAGYVWGIYIDDMDGRLNEVQENKETGLRLDGYNYVNPLLECDIYNSNMVRRGLIYDMKLEIEKRLDDKKLITASVYFRDLNNGPWVGVNEKELFTPASLMKVPMMIAFYKNLEANPRLLDKKIIYHEPKTMPQDIEDGFVFEENKKYSVGELVEIMIVNSSNRAAELLLENIDTATIQKVFHDLNIPDPANGSVEDYMNVQDYASFFRILYNASYLTNDQSEKALLLLTQTMFKDGLVAGLPKDVEVAHKFGERKYLKDGKELKQLHDCGVIYASGRNYVLCIMTRGNDWPELKSAIGDVSKIVYNKFVIENK